MYEQNKKRLTDILNSLNEADKLIWDLQEGNNFADAKEFIRSYIEEVESHLERTWSALGAVGLEEISRKAIRRDNFEKKVKRKQRKLAKLRREMFQKSYRV